MRVQTSMSLLHDMPGVQKPAYMLLQDMALSSVQDN